MLVTILDQRRRRVLLEDSTVIGSGGEAVIHYDPDYPNKFAIKCLRDPDRIREQKTRDFLNNNFDFTKHSHILVPLFLVLDSTDRFLGFEMVRLNPRFKKLSLLFKSQKFRDDFDFNTQIKAKIMAGVGSDIAFLHPMGIRGGDINSGGIMIHEQEKTHAWVDTDSFQFGKYPCMVGTPAYLHPELYGVQLDIKPVFKDYHDWWSYTVLLCQALLNGLHPFRSGEHPQFTSITERAEKGVTMFDSSVQYPSVGLPPEVITDDLLNIVIDILKRKNQNPFPLTSLQEYIQLLVKCTSCGLWYPAIRKNCPGCSHKTTIDMARMATVFGFNVSDIIKTLGRVLYYQIDASKIHCVAEESRNIVLYQWDSATNSTKRFDLKKDNTQGADFGIFKGKLVVCPDPGHDSPELKIYNIDSIGGLSLFKTTTTEKFSGGQAIWGSSNHRLYRIAGGSLVCGEMFDNSHYLERVVMNIFRGQTWLTVSRNTDDLEAKMDIAMCEMICGFHRVEGDQQWFIIRPEGNGFVRFAHLPIKKLAKRESVVDFRIYFGSTHAMLVRRTSTRGVERTIVDVISSIDGKVESYIFTDANQWENIHGKAYYRSPNGANIVMHPPIDVGPIIQENLTTNKTKILDVGKGILGDHELDRFDKAILVNRNDRISLVTVK